MSGKPLTDRQKQVIVAISELSALGKPPSLQELSDRLEIKSTLGTRWHLKALERKGFLRKRRKNAWRDIHLTSQALTVLAA